MLRQNETESDSSKTEVGQRVDIRGNNSAKRWDRKRQKVTVLGQKQTESNCPKTEIRKKVITEEAIWQSIGTEIDRR